MQMGGGWYDCSSSVLLCGEDESSIFGFERECGDGGDGGDVECVVGLCGGEEDVVMMGVGDAPYLDFFPMPSDECLALLVSKECDHLPRGDYVRRLETGALDLSIRREAIDWIGKVHAFYKFGPLSAYLSVNYLDRFLSCYEIPQGRAWMTQLLSVACLSLAAKMEETDVPLSLDFQVGDAKYVFESKTIQRMELLVLSTLNWRMQSVTPLSFMDYFLHKFNGGMLPSRNLFLQFVDLTLNTIRRVDLLEFRPSEVAAAVAICLSGKRHGFDVDDALSSSCIHVSKERVLSCYELIKEMTQISRPFKSSSGSISSVPCSPIGVLDAACLSNRSDETSTMGSQGSSHNSSPDAKRRKVDTWFPS